MEPHKRRDKAVDRNARGESVTDTVKTGTIMVQDSAPMPKSLVGVQPYCGEWSVVTDPNRSQLGKELESAGWTVSYTAGEMRTTSFGLNQETMIRNAVVQAIQAANLWSFNFLELTEVTRKSLLGVSFIKIAARGRHIQISPCFENVGESR
jgi:hypothetical protein